MIKCIVVDDEQAAVNVLKHYINQTENLTLLATFNNPVEALKYIREQEVHLVFLDIQMDEMTGLDLKKIIPEKVNVIFCTAYSEFAIESYELAAIDYLLKPVAYNRFLKAISRVQLPAIPPPTTAKENITGDYIFIRTDQKGKMTRIVLNDILFIEGKSNYIAIHCISKTFLTYSSMKAIEDYLANNQFVRIHKSFIVAIDKINHIIHGNVIINEHSLPIGKSYKETLTSMLNNRFLKQR